MVTTDVDQRVQALEQLYKQPPGTQISRVLTASGDSGWMMSLGQIGQPWKHTFTGGTISQCIHRAEQQLLAGKDNSQKYIMRVDDSTCVCECAACNNCS